MGQSESWKKKSSFIFAAIGSAVGLGNIWRFPYLCADSGGGAFLIAVIVALITVGVPALIMELSIGQQFQKTATGSFAVIKPKLEFFGWVILGVVFIVTVYYTVVVSWSLKYFFDAFNLSWGNDTAEFLYEKTMGKTSGPLEIGGIKLPLLIALLLTWISVVACIWKGTKTIEKIIAATVIIPWLILAILIARAVTLDGAMGGLVYYLKPTFHKLLSTKVWLAAYSQVVFSLSLACGVMISYGSYVKEKENLVMNAYIIAISDTLTAFLGGLAVFGGIGYLSSQTGLPIEELSKSGPGLSFIIYPQIINKLPLFREFFGVIFFLMLFTIGLNSAFAELQAITSSIRDKFGWSHKKINIVVLIFGFLASLFFITGSGDYWIHIVDYFAGSFALCFICFVECIIFGWIYGTEKIVKFTNNMPGIKIGFFWKVFIKYVSPIIILILMFNEVLFLIDGGFRDYPGIAVILGFIIPTIFIFVFAYTGYKKER